MSLVFCLLQQPTGQSDRCEPKTMVDSCTSLCLSFLTQNMAELSALSLLGIQERY